MGHQNRCTNIYEMKLSAASAARDARRSVQLVGRQNGGGGWLSGHRAMGNAAEMNHLPLASAARCVHGAAIDVG